MGVLEVSGSMHFERYVDFFRSPGRSSHEVCCKAASRGYIIETFGINVKESLNRCSLGSW